MFERTGSVRVSHGFSARPVVVNHEILCHRFVAAKPSRFGNIDDSVSYGCRASQPSEDHYVDHRPWVADDV